MRPRSHRAAAIKQKSVLSPREPLRAHRAQPPGPGAVGSDCFLMRLSSQGPQKGPDSALGGPTVPAGHWSQHPEGGVDHLPLERSDT